MLTLPDDYDLISFFEVEPELLDGNPKPWIYNELKFTTIRGEDKVIVNIYAPSGELTVSWIKSGKQLIKLKLVEVDSINIEMQSCDEFLTAAGMFSDHAVLLKIRLKPEVAIEFAQECIR